MSLDPNDPRPPYAQIANELRAAILTKKFAVGEKLPSGPELAERYGVARQTIQAALRPLREEGLIVSRQGQGVFVRGRTERPVGLRPHIEQAFEAKDVSIDFAGFAGETLHGAIQEPLDKIRSGRLTPGSITIRILLPDMALPMSLPCRAEDRADDPALRSRMQLIADRSTSAIVDSVEELGGLGLVSQASAEVRVFGSVPLFKLYVVNRTEAFFGFYPVVRHTVTVAGKPTEIIDPMGKDSVLFHHTIGDDKDDMGAQYVEQGLTWFESIWQGVAHERAA
jgi:DNA-binding transcriptional regulator YhcF (GntR family)